MDKPHFFHPTSKKALAFLIPILMSAQALADQAEEPTTQLEEMTINLDSRPKEDVGETLVTHKDLTEQLVQTSHDLVRYNTEVDVAEVGRYGNKGFAIRGVDGNRVAMNIDGMALPEVEVNEIYAPYGYMYEGRFSPDLELMGGVRISAGADSLLSGSGAVGGSISYQSKEPSQFLKNNKTLGGYAKVGYTNKNEEWLSAAGLAGKLGSAEFLLNYAHREGHELKNHDMRSHNKARLNVDYDFVANGEQPDVNRASLLYPDSASYTRDGVLGKFYYHLNDQHRIGVQALYQKQDTHSYAYSKSLTSPPRMAYDSEKMQGYGINYRFWPNNSRWLEALTGEYQYQDIQGTAQTQIWSGTPARHDRTYLRPTRTDNHQVKLGMALTPFNWGKFGLHSLSIDGTYAKQDYRTSKPEVHYNTDRSIAYAHQGNDIILPDAKKDIYSVVLSDAITLTDRFNAKLGIRYDHYIYDPYFQDETWFGEPDTNELNVINSALSYSRIKFYQDYRNGFYDQKNKFNHWTYHGLFNYDIVPDKLTARYKVGTGFLAPNITQMYSAFQGFGVTQLTNPNLKPEKSLNHELELAFKPTPDITLSVGGYHSKYKDFIHTKYWQRVGMVEDQYGCRSTLGICVMSFNLDDASVKGLKLGVEADLSNILNTKGKFSVSAHYHTSSDKTHVTTDSGEVIQLNTLSAVPTNLILSGDYISANNDWSMHGKVRVLYRKKAEDTKTLAVTPQYTTRTTYCKDTYYYPNWCIYGNFDQTDSNGDVYKVERTLDGYSESAQTYEHINRSKTAIVFDVYGSKSLVSTKTSS